MLLSREHHFLFSSLSVHEVEYPTIMDPWWLHTAIRSYRQGLVPGHKFKFIQSPNGKSHDCQSLFLQNLLCNKSGSWARTTCQTSLWLVDASYNWNKVPEDLHGGKELNSSPNVAVYSHDSHKYASQCPYYIIPINTPILGDITISQSWIKGRSQQFYISSVHIYVSCPTGIHKAKDEEPLWERLASDLGTLLGSGKLPLAPTTTPSPSPSEICFDILCPMLHFLISPTSAPGATAGPWLQRWVWGSSHSSQCVHQQP